MPASEDASRYSTEQCLALQNEGLALYEEAAGHCRKDTDCRLLGMRCPFGCVTAMHRDASLAALDTAVLTYRRECIACTVSCRREGLKAVCREGRCRVVDAE